MNTTFVPVSEPTYLNTGRAPSWMRAPVQSDLQAMPWWGVPPTNSSPNDQLVQGHSTWSLGLFKDREAVAFGQIDFSAFATWAAGLQKLQRQNRERVAAVYLDSTAMRLLGALDRETSIRWEELTDAVGCELHEVIRSVALLSGANLCDASPTRLRLSEHGDRLVAESVLFFQIDPEVEPGTIR